jgi:hypothetical protein
LSSELAVFGLTILDESPRALNLEKPPKFEATPKSKSK